MTSADGLVATAIALLLRRADTGGQVKRVGWMAAVERAIQGGEGALGAGITDTSDQEAEAFRRFLQERVIDRLEEEGVAHRMPRDENWELLEFDVALWASISGDILTLAEEVEATAQQLTDAKAAQRRVVPGSGLVEGGSRFHARTDAS